MLISAGLSHKGRILLGSDDHRVNGISPGKLQNEKHDDETNTGIFLEEHKNMKGENF